MLGKRSAQRGLFEADQLLGSFVGADTFYGYLAAQRGSLFRDEDFTGLYCSDNGRRKSPNPTKNARQNAPQIHGLLIFFPPNAPGLPRNIPHATCGPVHTSTTAPLPSSTVPSTTSPSPGMMSPGMQTT